MTIKEYILLVAPMCKTEADVVRWVSTGIPCKPQSVQNAMQRLRLDGHLDHLERGELHNRGRNSRGSGWMADY